MPSGSDVKGTGQTVLPASFKREADKPENVGIKMHIHSLNDWQHTHRFNTDDAHGERNTKRVILLTLFMMVIEISAGYLFGSMALLADGWHMGTHAVALGITVSAYYFARRHSDNPNPDKPEPYRSWFSVSWKIPVLK